MIIKTVFERVTRYAPTDTAAFIDYYNDAVDWLIGLYGARYVLDDGVRIAHDAIALSDTSSVRDEYTGAIINRIIFAASGNAERYSLARDEAESAYRTVWREKARGKVINIHATNEPYSVPSLREKRSDENV